MEDQDKKARNEEEEEKEEEEEEENIEPPIKVQITSKRAFSNGKRKPRSSSLVKAPTMNVNIPPLEDNITQKTKKAIYDKMEESRKLLSSIALGNSSVVSVQNLLSIINNCADAISALENIKFPQ